MDLLDNATVDDFTGVKSLLLMAKMICKSLSRSLAANDDENLTIALTNLSRASSFIPSTFSVARARLLGWDVDNPAEWLTRLNSGDNLTEELGLLMDDFCIKCQWDMSQTEQLHVTGPLQGTNCTANWITIR